MKKCFAVFLIAIMLLEMLSGCSTSPVDPTGSAPTGASQETTTPTDPTEEDNQWLLEGFESPEHQAVIKTALTYLARGSRIQYDDTRMVGNLYRWQDGTYAPEEYTTQNMGYTNCSAFVYDAFLNALDYDLGDNYWKRATAVTPREDVIYRYYPTGKETAEEQAAMEAEFRSNLKVGDIIHVRYNYVENGHVMLYVGKEILEGVDAYAGSDEGLVCDIIHSTGSNYDYSTPKEKFEQYGSIQIMSTDSLFTAGTRRYVFEKLQSIIILRPLKLYEGGVPENTKNRIKNMQGILAEKLSSHPIGNTVNPGEEITFTFSMTNSNDKAVTLEVQDTVPANTTYVSGAEKVDGSTLKWTVNIPAKETVTVSYIVKVNANAAQGDQILSENSTVGGVKVNCPAVWVGGALSAQQQTAIVDAVKNCDSTLRGMELANELYNKTFGTTDLLPGTIQNVFSGIYKPLTLPSYILNEKSKSAYWDMLVPGMFGGQNVAHTGWEQLAYMEDIRTRLPHDYNLMVGDLLVVEDVPYTMNPKVYLYNGETLYDLTDAEGISTVSTTEVCEKLITYSRFAVIRPAMAMTK